MPPDGHTSVTLPDELVEQLDDYAKATGAQSRADAVDALLEDAQLVVSSYVVEIDGSVVSEIANETANEVEGRMR